MSSQQKAQLRSDDALLRKFHAAKGNDLDIAFQWVRQGTIGTASQFRAIVGRIVENEVNRIAEEMNQEAQGEIPNEHRR